MQGGLQYESENEEGLQHAHGVGVCVCGGGGVWQITSLRSTSAAAADSIERAAVCH